MFQSPFYCLKKHKSGILEFWMWRPCNWALFLRKALPNLIVKLHFLKENNIWTESCLRLVLHSPRIWTSTSQICHDCSIHLHISFLNLEKALLSSLALASRDMERGDDDSAAKDPWVWMAALALHGQIALTKLTHLSGLIFLPVS